VIQALVCVVEAAVVELLVDELDILPGTVEQDAREAEVRDPDQVLPPDALEEIAAALPTLKRRRESVDVRAGLEIERDLLQLVGEVLLATRGGV